jgi:hypothetical protein
MKRQELSSGQDQQGQARTKSAGLLHSQDSVAGAVRIWLVDGAGRIVGPLAIDDETITMRAGSEFDGRVPDASGFLFKLDRLFLPFSEVASEHDTARGRRGEGEDLWFALDLF